jgi:hypothetical protein
LDALDYVRIQQVLAQAAQFVDLGDGPGFSSLFTTDGRLTTVGLTEDVEHAGSRAGREALADTISTTWLTLQGECRHWTGVPVIRATAGGASATSYLMVLRAGETPRAGVLLTGTYHDDLVQSEGRWLIASRSVEIDPRPQDGTGTDPLVLRRDSAVRSLGLL